MAHIQRKHNRLLYTIVAVCIAVLVFWCLSEWKGDKINAMAFDANDVASMHLYVARPGYEDFDVTDKEDLQMIIDGLNDFQYSGRSWRNFIKNGFHRSGGMLHEFYAELENGEEFGLVFLAYYDPCDFEPGTEIDGKYRIFKPVRSDFRGCRGSMDWFYTLYEKYCG